jgi:hypothetical protein
VSIKDTRLGGLKGGLELGVLPFNTLSEGIWEE